MHAYIQSLHMERYFIFWVFVLTFFLKHLYSYVYMFLPLHLLVHAGKFVCMDTTFSFHCTDTSINCSFFYACSAIDHVTLKTN